MTIPRCQHIKVNGTQCGSPALHGRRHCYFHSRHQMKPARDSAFDFPVLEDANAIQIALMQVIRAIADNKIECKRAGLLLYALQTASYNLKRANLEPGVTDVVLDTSSLAQEIAPPPDPVDMIRAMRRSYWKLRDPNLVNLDREIVARECAPAKPAQPAAPLWPESSARDRGSETRATQSPAPEPFQPVDTRPGTMSEPSPGERDLLMKFVQQLTAREPA